MILDLVNKSTEFLAKFKFQTSNTFYKLQVNLMKYMEHTYILKINCLFEIKIELVILNSGNPRHTINNDSGRGQGLSLKYVCPWRKEALHGIQKAKLLYTPWATSTISWNGPEFVAIEFFIMIFVLTIKAISSFICIVSNNLSFNN